MNGIHEVRGSIPSAPPSLTNDFRASASDALLSGVLQTRRTEFPAPDAIRACELPESRELELELELELESRWATALVRAQVLGSPMDWNLVSGSAPVLGSQMDWNPVKGSAAV